MTESIKKYACHLQSYYEHHLLYDTPRPSYCKLFSFTSDMFVDLSLVKTDHDDTSQAILQCVLDDNIENKTQISFKDLCLIPHGSSILIEGAPGIGKSTLAFALCYHWVSKVDLSTIDGSDRKVDSDIKDDPNSMALQHYSLLLLFQLRNESVQKVLLSVEDLLGFFSRSKSWQKQAIEDIIDNDGRGLMIILEGYDELNQCNKLIFDKIKQCIPQATIIVTCRPSHKHHLTQITQFRHHIGIVGFTKCSRTEYIHNFFKGDEALHTKFFQYLKHFPKIEGCLYVPINLVIILEIFRSRINDDDSCLPETTTELYDALVKMLICRHLKGLDHYLDGVNISSLKTLTEPTLSAFTNLCKVAYDNIGNKKISQPESFETLSLMQKESQFSLSEYGDVFVYNFLHSTIQEFLAAYIYMTNRMK